LLFYGKIECSRFFEKNAQNILPPSPEVWNYLKKAADTISTLTLNSQKSNTFLCIFA
jgi:hypothetical protein